MKNQKEEITIYTNEDLKEHNAENGIFKKDKIKENANQHKK